MSQRQTSSVESDGVAQGSPWFGWLPLVVLPLVILLFRNSLLPWVFMWVLAFSIYISLKWLTWWKARNRIPHSAWRSAAYLLLWPGMDADSFLGPKRVPRPPGMAWAWAIVETALGAILFWGVARLLPEGTALLRGWVGMLGLILLLHFGTFQVVGLVWQTLGVDAVPIMSAPLSSKSLSEFWGKRWNLGFRQLSYDLIFRPLHRSFGAVGAGFLVFLVSGVIHDFVISVPARAGYGLPTAYFAFQGVGVALERSGLGQQLGLRNGAGGWLFMAFWTAGPAFWLFHPAFVLRVIIPFMRASHAL
jgi:Membrane bound O-acyl transferase family